MGNCTSSKYKSIQIETLTSKEKELIQNSWSLIENKDEIGIQIMLQIFKTHGEIKYLWIFASNLDTEEEMLKNSQFCYHARKLGDSLNNVVSVLTSPAERVDYTGIIDLFKLGKRHFSYGVQTSYYDVFQECLIFALKKCIKDSKSFNNETRKAWKNAIQIMFIQFSEGILHEEKEQHKLNSNKNNGFNRNKNLI